MCACMYDSKPADGIALVARDICVAWHGVEIFFSSSIRRKQSAMARGEPIAAQFSPSRLSCLES